MEITKIAQAVQRSAYPDAYADHEQEGRLLASTLGGHSPGGLGCRLNDASTGDAAALKAALKAEYGANATVSGRTLTVASPSQQRAWGVGSYAVAKAGQFGATSVQVGSKEWLRTRNPDGWEWQSAAKATPATTVTITFP